MFAKIKDRIMLREYSEFIAYLEHTKFGDMRVEGYWQFIDYDIKDGDIIDIEMHSGRFNAAVAAEVQAMNDRANRSDRSYNDEEVEELVEAEEEDDIHESEHEKPTVHKIQSELMHKCDMEATLALWLAMDIYKMVAKDLDVQIPMDFAGVRKTITKRKPVDKASRLKELKKASDEALDELKVPPVAPGDVVAAMKSLDSRFKEIQGTATEEAAKKLLVVLFSKLSEEQLRKMVNKLSTKAKTKADKVAAIAAALFDKDTVQLDTMQKNLDATMSVIKGMTILLVERAGIDAGGIKQIASAIMNQKLGAKGSGTALNINVDELITGMTKMGMDESEDDEKI